jgi:alanine dehydrogenase
MLIIGNDVVSELLTMEDCIRVQEEAFKKLPTGGALHRPRIDMYMPCDSDEGYFRWGSMEGANDGFFAIRMKSDIITWPKDENGNWTEEKYCREPGTYCGLIYLISTRNAEPLAFINDGVLQHMRVGGGAGIGVKYLSREDSHTIGMLGSGGMARTFLEAICAVRPITTCKVFSPSKKNRETYAGEMSRKLGIEVIPVESGREAVRGMDILSTATDSMAPTFEPDWLEPGMHVAMLGPCEISAAAEARFDVKIRQGIGGLRMTETDRIRHEIGMSPIAWIAGSDEEQKRLPPPTKGSGFGGAYPDFCDLVHGRAAGRRSDSDVTFYHNMGNQGLQFAAVGGLVYRKAKAGNVGRGLPTEWFVQDIRD